MTGAIAILYTVVYLAVNVGYQHIDLEVYRFAVWEWWHDGDPYGPLPLTEANIELPFIYPPFALIAAIPFAVVPWAVAVIGLFAINVACIFGTLYVVGRQAWPSSGTRGALLVATAGVPVALALEPVRETFSFGQVNIVLMGLVAIDCLAPKTKWPRGLGVGLAAAIKLTPAAFLLFFLVRKDFRAIIVAGVTGVVATGIGFLAAPEASVRYWTGGFTHAGGLSGSPFRTNQSFQAILARFGIEKPLLTILVAVLVLALLVIVVYSMRRSDPATALALTAVLALMASPISWSHHWVWAVPALAVLLVHAARAWRAGSPGAQPVLIGAVFTGVLFVLGPFHWMPRFDQPGEYWAPLEHLVGNCYALAALAWTVGYAATRRAPRRPREEPVPEPVTAST